MSIESRTALAIVAALFVAGCEPPANQKFAKQEEQTRYFFNGEIEGCRLYSVRPRYGSDFQLAICGAATRTTWTEGCGKGCSREVSVQTARAGER